tara:strand:- start:9868 stop:10698 length:831 start_codon:yes stop_codon:yes gene_type:complete
LILSFNYVSIGTKETDMSDKIGIGIIAGRDSDLFVKCINSIPENIGTIMVVNDDPLGYSSSLYPDHIAKVFKNSRPMGKACCKNTLLRGLIQDGCEHLFIIEENHQILKPEVFSEYIRHAKATGIWHWNFHSFSKANKQEDGSMNPRQTIDYGDGVEVDFFPAVIGEFAYYLKGIIRNVGYMDERLSEANCLENIEHTYRITRLGIIPPFWWFNDIANSSDYIKREEFPEELETRVRIAVGLFEHLYKKKPEEIEDPKAEIVLKRLDFIQENYSKS